MEKVEVNGEKIYLKKDWTGWRTIEPIIDPETKKFSWKGFLNKKGFLTLGYLLFLLLVLWLAFREQLINYHEIVSNPCNYCFDCMSSKFYYAKHAINLT
jgi:hypothetical protein